MWGELSVPVQCKNIKFTALYALAITHTCKIDIAIGNCIYITYISMGVALCIEIDTETEREIMRGCNAHNLRIIIETTKSQSTLYYEHAL